MPGPWRSADLADFTGRVRFRRRFGYPGQIDSHERVWLTCAGVDASADIVLNKQRLGRCRNGPFEYEVTSLLRARNELEIIIEALSPETGTLGEVAMEVRCTAYLRNVRAVRQGQSLQVTGEVVGFADRPLELYILGDRQNLAYTPIEADPCGRLFQIVADLEAPCAFDRLCVDLVNLSSVWYSVELPFPV